MRPCWLWASIFVWGIVEPCFLVYLFVTIHLVCDVSWEIFEPEWYFFQEFLDCLRMGEGLRWGWGLWFYVEATLRTNGSCNKSKSTGWIVLKFGTHSDSDSAPTDRLYMVMCQRSRSHHHKNWLFLSFLESLLPTPFCPQTNCPSVGSSHVQVLVHLQANKPLISLSSNVMDELIIGITGHG